MHECATLMGNNRVRHGCGGSGQEAYAARLNEGPQRFNFVVGVLRRCAAERVSVEQVVAR